MPYILLVHNIMPYIFLHNIMPYILLENIMPYILLVIVYWYDRNQCHSKEIWEETAMFETIVALAEQYSDPKDHSGN